MGENCNGQLIMDNGQRGQLFPARRVQLFPARRVQLFPSRRDQLFPARRDPLPTVNCQLSIINCQLVKHG